MKSQKTRERILDISIQLFNEKKASNVSTVQISAEMQISPGNLYYYFANKEDLIRCIWEERMLGEIENLVECFKNVRSYEELDNAVDVCFKHYEKFIFFYSETATLFVNDPSLKELYDEKLGGSLDKLENVLDQWYESGMIIEVPNEIKRAFTENFIILMKAFVYREDSDKKHYKSNVLALIHPYLKENN
ncbi:MAG: TetR/AcrR family transcriptional regulator [Bacillota bacterium]|nr:TetR/AcrR family transcriptional regulator [Bacillota bacterium]